MIYSIYWKLHILWEFTASSYQLTIFFRISRLHSTNKPREVSSNISYCVISVAGFGLIVSKLFKINSTKLFLISYYNYCFVFKMIIFIDSAIIATLTTGWDRDRQKGREVIRRWGRQHHRRGAVSADGAGSSGSGGGCPLVVQGLPALARRSKRYASLWRSRPARHDLPSVSVQQAQHDSRTVEITHVKFVMNLFTLSNTPEDILVINYKSITSPTVCSR